MARTTALVLAAALSVAWQQAPPGGVGTLSIQTTPAEATVIVDGEVRGTSPIDLPNLAAGRHRVVIRRAGYLENSADVEVTAGRTVTLERTLTAESQAGTRPASNAPPPQRSSPPPKSSSPPPRTKSAGGGGGGAGKWIAIAGGAGAAGVAGVALKNRNSAPTIGTVVVSPNEVGLAALTNFSFSTSGANDRDGDALSYKWDFGDGTSASGARATHTYASSGTRSVILTVSDGKAQALATALVSVGDLAGTWVGLVATSSITMSLTQNNQSLTGSYTATFVCGNSNGSAGPVSGTISAAKAISITLMNPPCTNTVMQGTVNASVNGASGAILSGFNGSPLTFSLTRR